MKKIGLICLALVLALGALGVGAALWMGVLVIHGDVNTGIVDAVWSVEAAYDDEPADKDVSIVFADLMGPGELWIMIENAYPCVTYTVEWNVMNVGTVPIHFAEPMIMSEILPPDTTFTFTDMAGIPIDWSLVQLHPGDPPLLGKLTVHLGNLAEQGVPYMFDIMLEYGQYNEFPPL
jgi:hypothetical protein